MTGGAPSGIVVHSTGANNPNLKRYVQPLPKDANYKTLIDKLGVNLYGNHWNTAKPGGSSICVHAFIGKLENGEIATVQTLPADICCWGCANGKNGSYNFNPTARFQFEICEDGLTDEKYFTKVFTEAIEFCAYLCKKYNIPVSKISSHKEACDEGYASNHGDPDHWLKRHGKTMNWFRDEVQKLIDKEKQVAPAVKTGRLYRVQIGAFVDKAKAEAYAEKAKKAGFDAFVKCDVPGDVNGDDKVTAEDAREVLRKSVGLE